MNKYNLKCLKCFRFSNNLISIDKIWKIQVGYGGAYLEYGYYQVEVVDDDKVVVLRTIKLNHWYEGDFVKIVLDFYGLK